MTTAEHHDITRQPNNSQFGLLLVPSRKPTHLVTLSRIMCINHSNPDDVTYCNRISMNLVHKGGTYVYKTATCSLSNRCYSIDASGQAMKRTRLEGGSMKKSKEKSMPDVITRSSSAVRIRLSRPPSWMRLLMLSSVTSLFGLTGKSTILINFMLPVVHVRDYV